MGQAPRDFESRASTSFTTPACEAIPFYGSLPGVSRRKGFGEPRAASRELRLERRVGNGEHGAEEDHAPGAGEGKGGIFPLTIRGPAGYKGVELRGESVPVRSRSIFSSSVFLGLWRSWERA